MIIHSVLRIAYVGPVILASQMLWAQQPAIPSPEQVPYSQTGTSDAERSEFLNSKDPDVILQKFRTMYVDATKAVWFGSAQMKAALGSNKEFTNLHIVMVDDPNLADVVLEVAHTFAWDYPFSLRHQNTSMILISGKGSGPFSGPAGAKSVAKELSKKLGPYRTAVSSKAKTKGE